MSFQNVLVPGPKPEDSLYQNYATYSIRSLSFSWISWCLPRSRHSRLPFVATRPFCPDDRVGPPYSREAHTGFTKSGNCRLLCTNSGPVVAESKWISIREAFNDFQHRLAGYDEHHEHRMVPSNSGAYPGHLQMESGFVSVCFSAQRLENQPVYLHSRTLNFMR